MMCELLTDKDVDGNDQHEVWKEARTGAHSIGASQLHAIPLIHTQYSSCCI